MIRPIPSIHVFHSNVGGVGKTHLAALLADYFKQDGRDLHCFDSDSTWTGLSHYDSLNAKRLCKEDGTGGEAIDFDPVFESCAEISILDCGPVGYGAFLQYIKDNRLDERANWMLHVPLMRYRLESSRYGLEEMNVRGTLPIILWLNAFDGPFTLDEALSGLKISREDIRGSINLAGREYQLPSKAFGPDMHGLTLSERIEVQTGMKRFRLRQTQKSLARLFDNFFGAE